MVLSPADPMTDRSGRSDGPLALDQIPENSRIVLERRYLVKDEQGNVIETPRGMAWRIANNLAQAEARFGASPERQQEVAADHFDLIASLDFLPNSPTIMNAGRDLQQLSACFVLPVGDSIEEIFDAVKWTAMIHKSGGGTGFAFSRLRPRNDMVRSTTGVASGPISFMKIFNAATEEVKQGGTRRGANMGILRVDHPDILDFIDCKADMVSVTNFNISVAVTQEYMDALARNGDYTLYNPKDRTPVGTLNARAVWDHILQNAWKNGDPGLIFIDRMNEGRSNPVPKRGPIEATNPCGEQPLYPFDSCNLGSINLSHFTVGEAGHKTVDYARLRAVTKRAIRFLDNVVEMNNYPIPQIDETSRAIRRVGLGVMGWADMLIDLRIGYNTDAAVVLAEEVMRTIQEAADDASEELAGERGSFPDWEDSIYGPKGMNRPMRNSTRTTIAPTGTISMIAGCSGGCEPIFSLAFFRQHYLDKNDPLKVTRLTEVNEAFEKVAREEGFYSQDLMDALAYGESIHERPEVPDWVKHTFVTAHDIDPVAHVRIQAAFQRYTDNAVSKTINFPHEASVKDVEDAYMLAFREGCKGITIYRDGSRDLQVLSHGKKDETPAEDAAEATEATAELPQAAALAAAIPAGGPARRRLPDERQSVTHKFRVDDQEGYLTVGLYEDGTPGEIFVTIAKEGSTVSGLMDGIATLTSVALQYGVPLESLVQKLQGTRFEPYGFTNNKAVPVASSLTDYIFRYLGTKFLGHTPKSADLGEGSAADPFAPAATADEGRKPLSLSMIKVGTTCPECGVRLYYAEGCLTCVGCGYSKC